MRLIFQLLNRIFISAKYLLCCTRVHIAIFVMSVNRCSINERKSHDGSCWFSPYHLNLLDQQWDNHTNMIIPSTVRCVCARFLLKFIQYYRAYSHYNNVIMSLIACQITSLTIVYSIVYSDADQRKHQSSASLAFVRGIHRGPVNSPHKGPVTRKLFPFDDVIMICQWIVAPYVLWIR